jgi:hypothetical protein
LLVDLAVQLDDVCSCLLTQVEIREGTGKQCLEVTWENAGHVATLRADVQDMTFEVIATKQDEEDGKLHTYRCAPFCMLSPS